MNLVVEEIELSSMRRKIALTGTERWAWKVVLGRGERVAGGRGTPIELIGKVTMKIKVNIVIVKNEITVTGFE